AQRSTCAARNGQMNYNESQSKNLDLRFRSCSGSTSSTVIGQSFRFRLAKPAVGTRPSPNGPQVSPPPKRDRRAYIGRLRRWWTLRATRVGDGLSKAQAKILSLDR